MTTFSFYSFRIIKKFSIYKFKKKLWQDFGAPLRAAPGGSCPPCPHLATPLIATSAISSGNSTFGDNYRYLSYECNIGFHIWMLSLNDVVKCISLYV